MRYLLILLFLSGCGMDSYRPNVVYKNNDKYEADLKECIQYSKDVRGGIEPRSAVIGLTGLVGYTALSETRSSNDYYFKNGYELTDDCLIGKGYTIR